MPGTFAYAAATNTVTVTGGTSGSPADFASGAAADRAGTGTSLLGAWSPNSNTKALTYQVRPVELLALLISFVVAGKTTETDYIFITGTDAWGSAQTESIDVSAGNGTYVSTKRFKTITNIDCSDNAAGGGTVWADGTVAVTQPIWGVIWNKGNGQYQLDSYFVVGDGSTSTYFCELNKQIVINNFCSAWSLLIDVKANATFVLGQLDDLTRKLTSNPCALIDLNTNGHYLVHNWSGGTAYLYGLFARFFSFNAQIYVNRIWGGVYLTGAVLGPPLNKTVLIGAMFAPASGDSNTYIGINFYNGATLTFNASGTTIIRDSQIISSTVSVISDYREGVVKTLLDCILDNAIIDINSYWGGILDLKASINIHLTDKDGNNISGAIVDLQDKDGNYTWTQGSLITGADGKIVEQTAIYTRYWREYGGGEPTIQQSESKTPHTLTITAEGYQDYTDVITIDRKMDLEVAMLATVAAGGVSPVQPSLLPLGVMEVVA